MKIEKVLDILDDLDKKYRDERDGYLIMMYCNRCSGENITWDTGLSVAVKASECEHKIQVLQEARIALLSAQKRQESEKED